MNLVRVILVICLYSGMVHAFTVAQSGGSGRKTHVFVIGNSGELGDLFVRAAHTKVLRYKSLYPNDKIILIGAAETYRRRSFLRDNLGYKIVKSNRRKLTPKRFIKALSKYATIESIDFFAHSGAVYGIALDENTPFTYKESKVLLKIKELLTANAHIMINGCNSGYIQAPKLSKILEVPVFGSLTSTDFQRLHNNGRWYNNNGGNAPEGGWASRNRQSFSYSTRCYSQGGCIRMKPDNHNYSGYWGAYKVGLPYYRPFCAATVSQRACQLSMVREVLLYPSHYVDKKEVTVDQFKNLLIEYLCPQDRTGQRFYQCKTYLSSNGEQASSQYIFRGRPLSCTRDGCNFSIQGSGRRVSFIAVKGQTAEFTQLLEDFNLFMEAFAQFF